MDKKIVGQRTIETFMINGRQFLFYEEVVSQDEIYLGSHIDNLSFGDKVPRSDKTFEQYKMDILIHWNLLEDYISLKVLEYLNDLYGRNFTLNTKKIQNSFTIFQYSHECMVSSDGSGNRWLIEVMIDKNWDENTHFRLSHLIESYYTQARQQFLSNYDKVIQKRLFKS